MSNLLPDRWCSYDFCCAFTPGSHNAEYCPEHKCKRKVENAKKRLTTDFPEGATAEVLWKLQESRKKGRLEVAVEKNRWLLENSKIAFFDLETSDLNASIGMILCGSIKERGGATVTFSAAKDSDGILVDKNICVQLRDMLAGYDYVTTYYGSRFDIPYINTRLIMQGERPINELRHIDLYYRAKFNLKLHSNRLQVVGETLFGESQKTRVLGVVWQRAAQGDMEALKYIQEHCERDVEELEEVFDTLKGFINLSATRWRKYGASY